MYKSSKEQEKMVPSGTKRSAVLLEHRVRGGRSLARYAGARSCRVLQDRIQSWSPVESPADSVWV